MLLNKVAEYISGKPKLRHLAKQAYCRFSRRIKLLPPLGVAIEMTYACNWRCRMCFHHRPDIHSKMADSMRELRPRELSTGEIKGLLDEITAAGVRHVSFHGGEPLLRPDFCELVEHASRNRLHTSTFTNATLITDDIAGRLAGTLIDMGISIHGQGETHDLVTGIPGSFQRSIDGVRRLQEAKKRKSTDFPRIQLTCIITATNYAKAHEMIAVAREVGVKEFGFGMVTFTDDKAVAETCRLLSKSRRNPEFLGDSLLPADILNVDPGRYRQAMDAAKQAADEAGMRVSIYPFRSEQEVATYFSDPLARLGIECDYPWFSSVLSAYGDVYPCIQLSFVGYKMGNIRENKFMDIWRSKAYREFRDQFSSADRYLPICAKCCGITGEG